MVFIMLAMKQAILSMSFLLYLKKLFKKINVRYLESKETDNSLNEIDISQAKQIFGWTPQHHSKTG